MKKTFIILGLLVATYMAPLMAQGVVFYESFDGNQGTGGNDGKWSGSIASGATIATDNDGWTFGGKCYGANYCIRLGTGSAVGSATTPRLSLLSGDALLTFNAGSWGNDNTSLTLTIGGGGTLDQTDIALQNSVFTTYTVRISGGTSSTTIKFEGKGKRFFLDEVKVEQAETRVEAQGLAALRACEPGVPVYLTLGKDNPGLVEYVATNDGVDAYVRDNTSAVRFAHFLPSDAGWHTQAGGALIGSVLGTFAWNDGIPEFTHLSASIADSILCLDNWHTPTPRTIAQPHDLQGEQLRADYVRLTGVTLTQASDAYVAWKGDVGMTLCDAFGVDYEFPYDLKGREYNVQGIVGQDEILYTSIEEIMPELALDEASHDNGLLIGTYNDRLVNVTVERPLQTGIWNTLCLPFDISGFSNVVGSARIAELKGYDTASNTLEFESADDLEAGKPYLVFPEEEVPAITVYGTTIHSELKPSSEGGYTFVGVFDPTTLNAGDTSTLFLGADNTLYFPNVTNELKAFHAYFQTSNGATANISIDGVWSGISTATIDPEHGGATIYNVSGQAVGTTTTGLPKGVYVREGNKIIIK